MLKWKNNAAGTLAAGISAADTSIALSAGHGARFPATSTEDWFIATLRDAANNLEVIYVRNRTGDGLSGVLRGREGTTPAAFASGDAIELRWTNDDVGGAQDEAVSGLNVSGINGYSANLRTFPKLYNVGQQYAIYVPAFNANTIPNPSINLSGLGPLSILRPNSTPLAVGDFQGLCLLYYNGSHMVLMNPHGGLEAPGTMAPFAPASAPPGWLMCGEGAVASRADDSALFAVLGAAYGNGDGSSTFGLPNTSGRSPIGAGGGSGLSVRGLSQLGGAETHAMSSTHNGPHAHGITDPGHSHAAADLGHQHAVQGAPTIVTSGGFLAETNNSAGNIANTTPGNANIVVNPATTNIGATDSSGSGTPFNIVHPFIGLNFIIKR